MESNKDNKSKDRVIHTIRISGFFNTPPSEKEIKQAMREFERMQRFLKWIPLFFLGIMLVIFYLVFMLVQLKLPLFILVIFSTVMLIKELSTLFFSIQMRTRLMKPLERLRRAVDEIAKGHYGYTVEEDQYNLVGDLIVSFNRMSIELKKANDLKERYEQNRKELIAGISHDLKTPITSIVGYVDAIQTGVAQTEEKKEKYLSIIESNAQYTNKLIDDLFLFSKLDINQMQYNFEELPICEFLQDVIIEKQLELEEEGIEVTYSMEIEEEKFIPIDGKMVYRIMANILSNAVKYGDRKQPKIHIRALDYGEGVKVSIQDNGRGISEENVDQIFDVFYREDVTRNKEVGGTGLGLAIAKQLVEAHGGSITAESTLGEGTTITFTLDKKNKEEL